MKTVESGELRGPARAEVSPSFQAQAAFALEVVNHRLRSYGECRKVQKNWERDNKFQV